MSDDAANHVRLVRGDRGVFELVLDRPAKRNALTPAMLDRLASLTKSLTDDREARAVLFRGEGKAFCAGFDLSLCKDDPGAMRALLDNLSRAIVALRKLPVPVVLCAHGAAVAGGCALLGGADVVVTSAGAKLGYPVVRLGVSPAVTTPFLTQSMGLGGARTRVLDPDLIDGHEAHRLGLAHECAGSDGEALARARDIASALAAKPPHAMATTKRWLNRLDGSDDHATIRAALDVSLSLAGGEEERQRLAATWAKG